jgi:phage FluMu gp28-like protein
MSRSYDWWIHQQLEPDDKIITGNAKRIHEVKKHIVLPNPSPDFRTDAEQEAAQDEYLKRHGIC